MIVLLSATPVPRPSPVRGPAAADDDDDDDARSACCKTLSTLRTPAERLVRRDTSHRSHTTCWEDDRQTRYTHPCALLHHNHHVHL